jgi:hypothetical protein
MGQRYHKSIRKEFKKRWAREDAIHREFIRGLMHMKLTDRIKFGFKIIFRRY